MAALWDVVAHEEQTLHEVEGALWAGLLALGRALVALFLARVAAVRMKPYEYEGRRYAPGTYRTTEVGVLFGKVAFRRRVGVDVGARRRRADLPVDRKLGLCGGFSLRVVSTMARLAAQLPFAAARELFKRVWSWTPSSRATLRMVDALGEVARPFMDQQPPPAGDGSVLGIQVDAKGAPHISSRELKRRKRKRRAKPGRNGRLARRAARRAYPRQRRAPGNKSRNKKMAAVAVIYTLRRLSDGSLEGPIHKRVYATFGGYDALFQWLQAEAVKRGYGSKRIERTVFYADGDEALWRRQQRYFSDAEPCVDFYHVVEKLWPAAQASFPRASSKRAQARIQEWFKRQRTRIRKGRVDAVITELQAALDAVPATGPGTKHRRTVLARAIRYLTNNRPRMQYVRMRRLGLDIGSGVIEGTVRHLVGMRLERPGMRWGQSRAQAVLQLRCIHINQQWHDFELYVATAHTARLRPQPVPAIPHDPQKKAA